MDNKIVDGIYGVDELEKMPFPTPPKHITNTNVECLWNKGISGKGVLVSVIDTGCDIENPLLKDKIIHKYNFTSDDDGDTTNVTDYLGHGTHVTSIICANTFLDKVMGIAPDVKVMIYKVVGKNGYCNYEDIALAVNASVDRGADIINISLGGATESPNIHEAIKRAVSMQASVVCSSGNGGDGDTNTVELSFPSCYTEVIEVGATDDDGNVTWFSNNNQFVDCVVDGTCIVGFNGDGAIKVATGTSQSTPIVTGILALLKEWSEKEYGKTLSEVEIYSLLLKNTVKIKDCPRIAQGHGYVKLLEENFA